MDKVRVVLGYLQKYHFWLLCVVAIAASLMGWSMAKGTLSEEYQKGKSNIENKFQSLQQIQGDQNPPNDTWKEAIDKLTAEGREKVAAAWQSVYDEQQQVLKWPEEILGPQIINWLKSHKPTDTIPERWREQYRNEVVNVEFPKLVEIIDAKLDTSDARDARANKLEEDQHLYKVKWDSKSQEEVQASLRMSVDSVPSSEVVRLRQEDLWVYRALLNIISKTNETAQYSSHIKQINSISIGVEAAKRFQEGMRPNHIEMLTQGDAAPAAEAALPVEEEGEAATDAGRYVGDDGNPLGAGVAATEQFKRLPIYLNLKMNQNQITTLLTHCANYPLPVEVKQLRINPNTGEASSSKADARPGGGAEDEMSLTTPGPHDVTVEIHGIIYIYNPPDPAALGIAEDAVTGVGG